MTIQANIKTPNVYTSVNINTQRTGLPANTHRVLFVTYPLPIETGDEPLVPPAMPVSIYDKAQADSIFGKNSVAGRMMTAAIKTNRTVDVQCLGK